MGRSTNPLRGRGGRPPEVRAEEARTLARAQLAKVMLDGLPVAQKAKRDNPGATLFRDFALRFWADYSRHWKPSTRKGNRARIFKDLTDIFRHLRVDAIRKADVLRWRDSWAGRSGAFNRTIPILSVMMGYAEQLGMRPRGSNPCRGTPRYKRKLVDRFLSAREFNRLAASLRDFEETNPIAVQAIRLLIYTGARHGEVVGLRWECERFLSNQEIARLGEVLHRKLRTHPLHSTIVQLLLLTGCRVSEIKDLTWSEVKGGRLLLHDSKTGPRTVWLGDEAQMLLASPERRGSSDRVFWNKQTRRPVAEMHGFWAEVRTEANLPGVRLHDLRHSFASHAAARSETLPMIGKLLGHSRLQTTSRYAHLDDGRVLEAAERIGALIADAMGERRSLNHNTMCDIGVVIHDR